MKDEIEQMVAAAKAGRADGFQRLMSAYGARLYGFFFRATGSHHDAEDLLGDLSLRLVRMIKTYDDRGRFEPWLFRIASNLVRDRIRRRQVRSIVGPITDAEGQPMEDELPGKNLPVEAGLLAAEESGRLKTALEKLDDVTREMILLRHFADMSFKDIADLFECPIGTALAKVHRGLRSLRRMLEEPQDKAESHEGG